MDAAVALAEANPPQPGLLPVVVAEEARGAKAEQEPGRGATTGEQAQAGGDRRGEGADIDNKMQVEQDKDPLSHIPQPQPQPKEKPYQARERYKRIHLPVRPGMEDLSDDEGDGSEWALPTDEEKLHLPPGYDGKRRIRKKAGDPGYDEAKIKPSYYYPTESSASRGVPVFEPTYEEFRDFNSFISKIDNYGMRSGIVKIVPPKEWRDTLVSVKEPLKDTVIKDSIEQHFMGSRGVFRQSNIGQRRNYNVMQWKEMCDSEKYQTPNFFNAKDATTAEAADGAVEGQADSGTPTRTSRSGRVTRSLPVKKTPTPARKASAAAPAVKAKSSSNSKKAAKGRGSAAKEESVAPSETAASEIATSSVPDEDLAADNSAVDVSMDTLQNPQIADDWEESLHKSVKPHLNEASESIKREQVEEDAAAGLLTVGGTAEANTLNAEAPPTHTGSTVIAQREGDVARVNGTAPTTESSEQAPPSTPSTAKPAPSKAVSAKRKAVEEAQAEKEEKWQAFDYETLPWGARPSDYTVEECQKIEKTYWKRFSLGSPPMYGADGSGSLFDDSVKDWNVASLDDLLMRINPHVPMPGVNTPYLYFGMWRATFAWHVEDADLYSINYIHFGAPKFWYSVPQSHAERFERVIAGYFPRDQQKCPEFMRHKSFLVSPTNLARDGVPLNRCIQFPGEIILTYPYGYHSGFNIGFNCAESINFATEGWLDIGRRAKACVCQPDTVRINVDNWLEEARQDAERMRADPNYAAFRKRQREFTSLVPQQEAKKRRLLGPTFDTIRRSIASTISAAQRSMQAQAKKAQSPAAASPSKQEQAQQPQQQQPLQTLPQPPQHQQHQHQQQTTPAATPQPKTSAAAPKPVSRPTYPCALCPEPVTDGLVRIHNAKKQGRDLYAHKLCVTFTPTTWCSADPETGEELVFGYDQIEKERWNLKCGLCHDKHGTKIQCTKSAKCVRAFHATCAIKEDSGVVLDAVVGGRSVLEPPRPEDENQQRTVTDGHLQLVVICRTHNPVWMKAQNERKKLELAAKVAALPIGAPIQIRTTTGVWAVTLVGHRPADAVVEIQFGNGEKALCKHNALVWPEETNRNQQGPNGQGEASQSGGNAASGLATGSNGAGGAAGAPAKPRVHAMERAKSGQSNSPASGTATTTTTNTNNNGNSRQPFNPMAAFQNNPHAHLQLQALLSALPAAQQMAFHQWYTQSFLRNVRWPQMSPQASQRPLPSSTQQQHQDGHRLNVNGNIPPSMVTSPNHPTGTLKSVTTVSPSSSLPDRPAPVQPAFNQDQHFMETAPASTAAAAVPSSSSAEHHPQQTSAKPVAYPSPASTADRHTPPAESTLHTVAEEDSRLARTTEGPQEQDTHMISA